MPAPRKYIGPYRVQNIGESGNVYQVVCMILRRNDGDIQRYEELNPPRTFSRGGARQSANRLCGSLNQKWQEDHALDDNYGELMALFS